MISMEDFDLNRATVFLETPRARFKRIRARYQGLCLWCAGTIEYGEMMQWSLAGCAHTDCFEESHGSQSRAAG